MDRELAQLSRRVGQTLASAGWKLVTAESCTGGWVAQVVTATAGSSQWYERGFITYSNEAKRELLGVRPETIQTYGAVSEATAREMADGALRASRAQVALAITGIAGPAGGSAEKPVGTVCFSWLLPESGLASSTERFEGDRATVRRSAVVFALEGLIARLAVKS